MGCSYYMNGRFSKLYTELYGYIDDTELGKRSPQKVYEILRNNGLVLKDNGTIFVIQGPDMRNQQTRLREFDRMNTKYPGLVEYVFIKNTPPKFQKKANKLHVLKINNDVLQQALPDQRAIQLAADQKEIDEILREREREIAEQSLRDTFNDPDVALSEMARRENKSDQSLFSDLEMEDEQIVAKKAVHLKNAFAKAGFEIDVVFDEELDSLGQVDARKTGERIIVRFNPNLTREDTAYHEFGHIYIDMLGVDNPVVASAIQQLRGTTLYNQVAQKYPELDAVALDKEVLATAIGIEGAKITRKNPSKLQILINKIFREFAKFLNSLNIAAKPNDAATLAREMFTGDLRVGEMLKPVSAYAQKSKQEQEVVKIIQELRVKTQAEIRAIRKMPDNTKELRAKKEKMLDKQESLALVLKKAEKVDDLFKFVEYTADHVSRMEARYEDIISSYKENNIEKSSDVLNSMYQLKRDLDALDTIQTLKGVIKEQKRVGKIKKIKRPSVDVRRLDTMEERILEILDVADGLEYRYERDIIPMMADSLIAYHSTTIDDKLQEQIDNIEKTKRWRSVLSFTDPDYKALKNDLETGKIDEAEFEEAVVQLAVSKVKSKQIPDRTSLINELKAGYKDKSGYSLFFDPLIYSNDQAVQLFAKLIKTANIKKNERTLDLKGDLNIAYNEFAQGMDESNVEELNKDIVEVIEVTAFRDGKEETIKVNALVQPTDLAKFKAEEKEMYRNLAAKYNKPMRKDFKDQESYDEANTRWGRQRSTVNRYKLEEDSWYSKRMEGIEGWRDKLSSMDKAIARQKAKLESLELSGTESQKEIAKRKLRAMRRERKNSITDKGSPKGQLAKPKMSLYTNPKWTKIQADPRLKKYYDFVIKEYNTGQDMVGASRMYTNPWDDHSYVLPSIRKKGVDRVREQGVWKTAKDLFNEATTIQDTDDMYGRYNSVTGEIEKKVPVYYTNLVPAQDISVDVASSLYQFRDMAHNFVEKSNVAGTAMVMRDMMLKREVLATGAGGAVLLNEIATSLGLKIPQRKKGTSNSVQHLEEFIDSQIFGAHEIKTKVGNVELNKVANTLNSYTALNNLSFNFLQAANQTILDNLTNLQEGIAGEFYTAKDIAWAKSEYVSEGAGLRDIGKFMPVSKLGKALEFFDALVEVTDREGRKIVGGKLRKVSDLGNLMSLQSAAEHEMASTRMLALLHATKVKDKNGNPIMKDGKEANLWDMLLIDDKGKMSIDPQVANVNSRDITLLLGGISRRTNQTKGNVDRSVLERRWYGKMFMLFRRYLNPGIRRRFGHGEALHVDEELGTVTQGMYMSFITMMQEAYDQKTINLKSVFDNMSALEQQNVKRTAVELGSIVAAMAIVAALSRLDDDEETWVSNFVLYQAKRYQTEMMQWNPVFGYKDIFRIAKSPAATVRPLENGLGLIEQIAFYELPHAVGMPIDPKHIYYQRRTGRFNKGDRKIRKDIEDMLPIIRGIQKSKTPEDAIKWFSK